MLRYVYIFAYPFCLESGDKGTKNLINTDMGEILTKHGDRQELAKIFNVSIVTIRSALKGRTKSPLAQRIRKAAIERGGVEVELNKIKRL
ncbi:MAG TPA: hypothetical protein DEG28_00935 [Porphyromonadaceae bacterium]|nr:hypothetical protein [Porphyromonadaceae bacterium]